MYNRERLTDRREEVQSESKEESQQELEWLIEALLTKVGSFNFKDNEAYLKIMRFTSVSILLGVYYDKGFAILTGVDKHLLNKIPKLEELASQLTLSDDASDGFKALKEYWLWRNASVLSQGKKGREYLKKEILPILVAQGISLSSNFFPYEDVSGQMVKAEQLKMQRIEAVLAQINIVAKLLSDLDLNAKDEGELKAALSIVTGMEDVRGFFGRVLEWVQQLGDLITMGVIQRKDFVFSILSSVFDSLGFLAMKSQFKQAFLDTAKRQKDSPTPVIDLSNEGPGLTVVESLKFMLMISMQVQEEGLERHEDE
mmetsp:Transcript_10405/g.17459  ORF Transcript_10405/g.17459 Transcript_10405/m.17459 type:complete len:313 (+) Transcript_10405:526-1464(+)